MTISNSLRTISKFIKNTPLDYNYRLSKLYNCNIFLKREDLQITRSFKIRGVFNKIQNLSNNKQISNIVCASAGNHAQGVAYICNKLNIKGDIFLPVNTPKQKINSIENFGGKYINLNLFGNTVDDSLKEAIQFSIDNNYDFIHPFNDDDIIDGQGTIATEIYSKIKPDIMITSIGGGGLASGLIKYCNEIDSNCKIIGAEPENADSMITSMKRGEIIKMKNIDTFVDGAAISEVGNKTYDIVSKYIYDIKVINNGLLCSNLVDIYQNEGIILEPAGALSVSCLKLLDKKFIKDKNIVCILSGGNNDIMRYNEILEKKLIYDNVKHYFIIKLNQVPGQLKLFVKNILGDNDDIVLFDYLKKTNKQYGKVLIGIQTRYPNDIFNIINNLNKYEIEYIKLNENDLIYNYLV